MNNPALHNPHLEGEPFFWEAGPVGVFLSHGYTATTAEVRLFARRLFEKGYSVAGPLLAGHGSRPEDLNRVHWRDWVESGEKVYRQLKSRCKHVFLGGQSMGGLVALYLASQHPEVAGILLYAPAIKLTLTAQETVKLYAGSLFLPQVARTSLDVSDRWQGYPGLPLKGAVQLMRMQRAVRRRLGLIRQPIILFQGRRDTTVHASAGEVILQGVGSTIKEHHWMENSSHPILLDDELDAVTELSINFMEKVLML